MDGFLIRLPKNSDATRSVYHTRQYQSDDAEKMGKPHKLSICFEGLDRLKILKELCTIQGSTRVMTPTRWISLISCPSVVQDCVDCEI